MSFFTQASFVMDPNVYGDGKLYVPKPTDGSGDLTFTRSTSGTRVNQSGLIEKVRTNLVTYSNDFSNAIWQKDGGTSLTANAGTDPNGGNDAWEVVMPSGGNLYQNSTPSWNGAQSVYAKVASGTESIKLWNGVSGTTFNLTTSWQRISVINVNAGQYVNVYNDSGSSVTFLIAFAQAETGDIATDYIPTTTSAVTVGPVANLPRLNYGADGCPSLLLEPQRTNYATNSEDISQAVIGSVTVTKNQTTAPDGYVSADSIIDQSNTSSHNLYKYYTSGSASGTAVRFSLFAKKDSHDWFQLAGGGATDDQWANFNLATGVIGNSKAGSNPKIEAYSNGWYRVSITLTTTSSSALVAGFISLTNNTNPNARNFSYSGTGDGVFAWGYQLEEANYTSSYIPTLSSAVTRNADACYKTGISSVIGQTEGTLFCDFNVLPSTLAGSYYLETLLSDGTLSNKVSMAYYNTGRIQFVVFLGGSLVVNINLNSYGLTVGKHKFAFAYKLNDYVAYVDGASVGTDTSAGVPTLSALNLYDSSGGTHAVNQALLFKTRLSNADLAKLTSL